MKRPTLCKLESLECRIKVLEDFFNEEIDDQIRKVGNKWKILKSDGRSFWDAEAALRAYWANKH